MSPESISAVVESSGLKHIAIIMDGNGRWAQNRGKPRIEGHRAGAKTVRNIVEESRRVGLRHLTLFSFSTENWKRPDEEVSGLMKLFGRYLKSELATLLDNGVRLRACGDLTRLPDELRVLFETNIEKTKDLTGMDLTLAISYGGREEILRAAKRLAKEYQDRPSELESLSEERFGEYLDLPDLPNPDLLIRTGNEHRISNFLLWQLAYSEIIFSQKFWPDFSADDLHKCIHEFSTRKRRFGMTEEQVGGVRG